MDFFSRCVHFSLIESLVSQINLSVECQRQLALQLNDVESELAAKSLEVKTLRAQFEVATFERDMAKEEVQLAPEDRLQAIQDRNAARNVACQTENRLRAERDKARAELKAAQKEIVAVTVERNRAQKDHQQASKQLEEYREFFELGATLASYK